MTRSIFIEIYSRPGCHLCDDAKSVIDRIGARMRIAVNVAVTNVDDNPEHRAAYGTDIPVVFIEGEEAFRHRVAESELERKLRELWNRSTS